jgi:hypothetical protein
MPDRHRTILRKISTFFQVDRISRSGHDTAASGSGDTPGAGQQDSRLYDRGSDTPNNPGDTHFNDIRVPPSGYDLPPSTEPVNILAFRTITMLLSWLQQTQVIKVSKEKFITDPTERQKLKILNALSTIIVVNNNVVAVVAKSNPDIPVSKGLEVIACARLPDEGLIAPQTPNIVGQFWQFLLTKNPRRDDPLPAAPFAIVDPMVPADLDSDDPEELKTYIDGYW